MTIEATRPLTALKGQTFCIMEMGLIIVLATTFLVFYSVSLDFQTYGLLILVAVMLFLAYPLYISPVLVHKDPNEIRGLGRKENWYIRTDNIKAASINYGLLLLVVAPIILIGASIKGIDLSDADRWRAFAFKLVFYFLSALVQSLCFLGFFLVRMQQLVPGKDGSWKKTLIVSAIATVVFAVYHIPNYPLMIISSTIGFVAATIFQRTPNILPAVVVHAIIGSLFHRIYELNMKVGQSYLYPDQYFFRELIPGMKEFIGSTF